MRLAPSNHPTAIERLENVNRDADNRVLRGINLLATKLGDAVAAEAKIAGAVCRTAAHDAAFAALPVRQQRADVLNEVLRLNYIDPSDV